MAKIWTILLIFTAFSAQATPRSPYRLGVVLVVDQFRADYLMRFKDRFQKAGGREKGFRFLMEQGAYFPLADHGLLQDMTGPGHAAILSGSYPYRNGISTNHWFDRVKNEPYYCVQDNDAKIIGNDGVVKDAKMGISPRTFNASTVGDELKNVDRASRVVSLSLKDRAAVLLGGHRTDHTIWFDDKHCQWVTSDFFEKVLPEFVKKRNAVLASEKGVSFDFGTLHAVKKCEKESLRTPWGVEQTFALALGAVEDLGLGKGKDTDLLAISLSSHDYLGHNFGPNHENMETMTLEEDRLISKFFNDLAKKVPGGLNEVFIVLTGDHGIPPKNLPVDRVPSQNIPEDEMPQIVEKLMTEKFGAPKSGHWISAELEFQLYLDSESLKAAGITVHDALKPIRERLTRERYVDQVWSRDEILIDRKVPAGQYGVVADRTLSKRSGDIIVVLRPYFYSDAYPITHMTFYSYDRYVPLIFYGKTFKPGTYRQIVNVADIAPTLSRVFDVLPPSQSEGRVLTEILR